MGKMEFTYTSGWEEFEQYCKELYRGYLNRYCQGNEKGCEDEINQAYASGMSFIQKKVKENKEILKQLWVAAFIGNLVKKYDLTVTVKTQSCAFILGLFNLLPYGVMKKASINYPYANISLIEYEVGEIFYNTGKMESKEWGTNFWMQDVIRWKLYHEAPQGRAGSKYYNCLRTLVKNAQNAIGSCELIDCAYMNINKRGGYNTADKTRIRNYAKKYEKFIEKEIELLDPEIIICCGILDDQGICKKILKSCGKSVYLYKRHPSRYSKDLCNWEKIEEL